MATEPPPAKRRRIQGPLLRRTLSLALQPDVATSVARFVEKPILLRTTPSWSYQHYRSIGLDAFDAIVPHIDVSGCGRYEFPHDVSVGTAVRALRASHHASDERAKVVFSLVDEARCPEEGPTGLLFEEEHGPLFAELTKHGCTAADSREVVLYAHAKMFRRKRAGCSVQ